MKAARVWPALALLVCAAAARADVAVTIHGTVLTADTIRVEGEEIIFVRRDKEERFPCGDVYVAEKADGALVWAPDFDGRMRGYAYLARERRRDLCVELLEDALRIHDKRLARTLLNRCEADGFTGKKADALKRRVEKLEKLTPKVDEEKAKAIQARLAGADAMIVDLLVERARVSPDDEGLRLLRAALLRAPKHAAAAELLKARAAKDFAAGDARFWLDWRVDLESAGARLLDFGAHRDLMALRALWRKDLYAFEAGPIRLVTPVRHTRTVGRCLAYSQLTCQLLGEVFKPAKPRPRIKKTLTIVLYGSKKGYLAQNSTSGETRANLQWTLGNYSPGEQLSHIYWSPDRDAERRIARVFVHEITHQWMTEMNPYYGDADLRMQGPSQPGYWLVEGIATLIEEGNFDVDEGRWTLFDSRSPSLDIVHALAGTGKLIPWDRFYSMSVRDFRRLRHKTTIEFHRRWSVGKQVRSEARMFYEQAGATCQFLYHADGGRYRQQLIDLITARYTGKSEKLDIKAAVGMSRKELGRLVEKFAKQVATGWRPQ